MPMPQTIQTPYGRATYNNFVYQPMGSYSNNQKISWKYDFTVVMRSGDSIFTQRMAIRISEKPHQLVAKKRKGKRVIVPVETRQVFRINLKTGHKLTGIPADSCWLFKSVRGKINGYSPVAEEGYWLLAAIQQGNDGPLLPITKENVQAMIPEPDEKMKKLIEEGNLIRAVQKYNEQKE